MENATKALLIVAGVLIGVMILSLGVFLYANLGSYISETKQQMEITEIDQFNVQFTKYINMTEDPYGTYNVNGKRYKKDFNLTIQDVVTVANLAYQNNFENELTDTSQIYNDSTYYVSVNAWINGHNVTNIEKNINTTSAGYLSNIQNQTHEYRCFNINVEYSEVTGRVYKITFN